ncbi:MAG: thioredoxin family protein [Abitibacteriaceae bacterium]|nr:thioredoxin family protein [Abditibacteriaceae bacterium]MBV9864010.1 thioredoxin family protein [Abditibacteriaceae bacterium]
MKSWISTNKLIGTTLIALAVLNSPPAHAKPAKTLPWRAAFQPALIEAKRTHKPLMVFFHASWCTYCHVMDDKTFPTTSVIAASQKWIPVRLDEDQNQAVSKKYQVNGDLPTILLLKPNGALAGRVKGFQSPTTLIKAMNAAYAKAK